MSDAKHLILVLGATGSCGRLFVDHALHNGFTVRTRPSPKIRTFFGMD